MFERYHSDLKYWGVEPVFFDKFPEFKGVMSVAHVYEEVEGEGPGRAVSPIDSDASVSPREETSPVMAEPMMSGGLATSDRHDSNSNTATSTSSGSPPSPEEVHLDMADVDMMDGLAGTPCKEEGLTFEFDGDTLQGHGGQEGRDGSGKVVFEGADAYIMELFNDLPCVA